MKVYLYPLNETQHEKRLTSKDLGTVVQTNNVVSKCFV